MKYLKLNYLKKTFFLVIRTIVDEYDQCLDQVGFFY